MRGWCLKLSTKCEGLRWKGPNCISHTDQPLCRSDSGSNHQHEIRISCKTRSAQTGGHCELSDGASQLRCDCSVFQVRTVNVGLAKKLFDEIDLNHDGHLDESEVESLPVSVCVPLAAYQYSCQ